MGTHAVAGAPFFPSCQWLQQRLRPGADEAGFYPVTSPAVGDDEARPIGPLPAAPAPGTDRRRRRQKNNAKAGFSARCGCGSWHDAITKWRSTNSDRLPIAARSLIGKFILARRSRRNSDRVERQRQERINRPRLPSSPNFDRARAQARPPQISAWRRASAIPIAIARSNSRRVIEGRNDENPAST